MTTWPDSTECIPPKYLTNAPSCTPNGRIRQLFDVCIKLREKKAADYESDPESLGNCHLEGWFGIVTRLQDKVSRLLTARENCLKGKPLVNEGVLDTFKDIIIYSSLGYLLYEDGNIGRWDKLQKYIAGLLKDMD